MIELGHIKFPALLSGFLQLLSIQYRCVPASRAARGKNFLRYLWSSPRWWSCSQNRFYSDTPDDAILTICSHKMQKKQCLFLRGSSGSVGNRAANGALVNITFVIINPLSQSYYPQLDLGALVDTIHKSFPVNSFGHRTCFSLAATSKTHFYHWTACCLLCPVTREHQYQQIKYC